MAVQIAQTLWSSLAGLSATDTERVGEFIAKLQRDRATPGISLERLNGRDPRLWSARISQGLRAILHRDGDIDTVLYAGQHDDAYRWAESRRLERNLVTGALQIVQAPEVVEQQLADTAAGARPREPLFAHCADDYLLRLGVPPDWLPTLRRVASDDMLQLVIEHLPDEVGERLIDVAAGIAVEPPAPLRPEQPAGESPDTQRRFFILESDEDLRRMLEAPLATWLTFLHPSQRALVTKTFHGPAKVTGSAGTGKTVVAMHRARHLARQGKRVLLTTYVRTLCWIIERNLRLLCSPAELARITVDTVHGQALDIVRRHHPHASPTTPEKIAKLIEQQQRRAGCAFEVDFLAAEWEQVVEAQGVTDWPAYRAASRAGRGRALTVKERQAIWPVFEGVLRALQEQSAFSYPGLCRAAKALLDGGRASSPYDSVIVDEAQDLGPQELAFLAALAGDGADRLMVAGDGGQRIYAKRFSLRAVGIDVRGRSHVLRINYRTTEQIRRFADRVLGATGDDLDGGVEDRRGTRSILRGPEPRLRGFATAAGQYQFLVEQIAACRRTGVAPEEIAVFAHTNELLDAVQAALTAAGVPVNRLRREESAHPTTGVNLGTMHRAKGLEFKVVFVVDCSADYLPLPRALQAAADEADREDILARERQLLYVSLTRARDELFLTWVGQPSRFLTDLVPTQEEREP